MTLRPESLIDQDYDYRICTVCGGKWHVMESPKHKPDCIVGLMPPKPPSVGQDGRCND